MSQQFIYSNFLNTTLGASASASSSTLTLASSANLPTLTNGQIMPLTLNDAATGTVYEIVYVTAISGATLTVERAQEGTSAQSWAVGDYAYCAFTAETTPQSGLALLTPTASESYTPVAEKTVIQPGTLTAAITITLELGTAVGQEVIGFGSASAYTVEYASSVTTGSPAFILPDGSEAYSLTVPASGDGQGAKFVWDGTNWRVTTFGLTVVAPAVADNEAVQLGQLHQYGGGNFQGWGGDLTTNTTLTSSQWGQAFQIGASGITITLPTTNGNVGQAMWFYPQ